MLTPRYLRTEYKVNPIGMDEKAPRFSWQLAGTGKIQKTYRITVTDESGAEVWDSGVVKDGRSSQIMYAGALLKPFTKYSWTLRVTDESGKNSRPVSAAFETGFLGTAWTAKWITCWGTENNRILRFYKDFTVSKPVAKARLYTTALGLYEAYINGKNVTEDIFTPGWTDYYHRVQYQAYDVTKLIKPGANRLADQVGEGWYCGTISRNWTPGKVTYGSRQALLQELHITYADGSKEIIATNKDFPNQKTVAVATLRHSDIYQGELYDADQDDREWKLPGPTPFGGQVQATDEVSVPEEVKVEWNSGAPVRRIMTLKPVSIKFRKQTDTYIVDFGQNITGRERIRLKNTRRGRVIVIRHGEMLNEDGSLYVKNLRSADATTTYLAGNHRSAVYEPTFTFYGFRYVEISGWPGKLTADDIEAVVIHSDLAQTGRFSCSNPLINKLFENIVWGQRGNFLDVPTDCPQRDERFGWTGDVQVFANAATYNMDSAAFYTKWIRDLNLCQRADGAYPHIAPNPFGNHSWVSEGVTGWADAGIVCPDVILRKYADVPLYKMWLENMVRWLDYEYTVHGNSYLVGNAHLGDWLNCNDETGRQFLATAYLAGMAALVARNARLVGDKKITAKMGKFASEAKKTFQKHFVVKNQLTESSQTAMVLALYFDLVPENAYKNVCNALVKRIRVTYKNHLSTGFLGTPLLLKTLSKIGQTDLAYAVLEQTTYPGWLYPVTQGATTMWERWNSWNHETGFGDVSMNSFNHYAYGAVADWFYEYICGIQPLADQPENLGFKHFRLAPQPGKSLQYARAEFDSPYGRIKSGWTRGKNGKITYTFTIPVNTTAEVVLPEKLLKKAGFTPDTQGRFILGPGEYTIS